MKYAIVFERTPGGYSAYVPDLPGCVAAAGSYETTEKLILRGDGDPIPEPSTPALQPGFRLPTMRMPGGGSRSRRR